MISRPCDLRSRVRPARASNTIQKRRPVLCNILDGEKSVGELADIAGLSSAALSQHLGKMAH
jgi:DNA-binding transcriptional ArsR family regulator